VADTLVLKRKKGSCGQLRILGNGVADREKLMGSNSGWKGLLLGKRRTNGLGGAERHEFVEELRPE